MAQLVRPAGGAGQEHKILGGISTAVGRNLVPDVEQVVVPVLTDRHDTEPEPDPHYSAAVTAKELRLV
jgi:hypothetical protein